jgi:MFS superfamily sulfate permease-like transporter
MSLTLLVGIIQMGLGASGLGFLTSYFSDTFISSYTCGSAIHVIKSQLKDLLGITNSIRFSGLFNIQKSSLDLITKLPDSNWRTIILSLLCIIYLIIFKEYINPVIKKKI